MEFNVCGILKMFTYIAFRFLALKDQYETLELVRCMLVINTTRRTDVAGECRFRKTVNANLIARWTKSAECRMK